MRKSKKRVTLLIILILLITFIVLISGGSYSKYLTQVNGKGVIEVAKWAFLVNGETASVTNINLAKTYKKETLLANTIAPGTCGSFDIEIDTTGSEVGIDYKVEFENEENKPQNLLFTYDGHTVNTVKELEQFLIGKIEANSNEKIKKMTINWNWPYETGNLENEKSLYDKEDTNDGKILQQYRFDIVVTGMQVKPIS